MYKLVLFTEDVELRNRLFHLIRQSGYDCITLSKQDKIIEILQSEKPHLVLLDIDPSPQIFERIQKIVKLFDTIPMLLLTSDISADIEKQGFASGAKEVLSKNFQEMEMKSALQKILGVNDRHGASSELKGRDQILIVDDEDSIRSLLQAFLKSKGHPTLTAKNGEEALKIVQEKKPAMVLLDVMMPGMNGIETLKKIREIDPEVGVVMATGIGDEEMAREASRHGSYHYVLKPFDLKYLELVVLTRMTLAV